MRLTLLADTELWGEPSRDALTEGPGGLSLSVEDERLGSEHKKQSICCRTQANNAAIVGRGSTSPRKPWNMALLDSFGAINVFTCWNGSCSLSEHPAGVQNQVVPSLPIRVLPCRQTAARCLQCHPVTLSV